MKRLPDDKALRLMLVGDAKAGAAMPVWAGADAAARTDVVMVDIGVSLQDVIARLRDRTQDQSLAASVARLVGQNIADVERELILQTLRHCGGNRSGASAILGISVRTMRNKLRLYQSEGIAVTPAPMGVTIVASETRLGAGA